MGFSPICSGNNALSSETFAFFGPERDDETGEWRGLHNGELHDLYGKPDIIRTVDGGLEVFPLSIVISAPVV